MAHDGRLPRDTFGMRLRTLRHDLTLERGRVASSYECAEVASVAQPTWRSWERDMVTPRDRHAIAREVAGVFGFSESWLLDQGNATDGRLPRDCFAMRLTMLRHDLTLRTGQPVTVKQCADGFGVSDGAWRYWERDFSRPQRFFRTVAEIADTFGYSEEWLLGEQARLLMWRGDRDP